MIPILYASNETSFQTQGLGALGEAASVNISRVLNGKDELVMVYPNTGIRYADLANDLIIYAQPEYRKSAQPYQIYRITKPLNGLVTVYARHVGTQRAGYIPVTAFTAASAVDVMYNLPLHMAESNPFTFWTDKNTVANFALTHPASLGNVLGGMEGSILDVYGGEYEFDGYTIKLWNRRGADNGVELRYAKNITDIEHSEDFSSIVTGVCPYWEGMDGTVVVLPEVVVRSQYADYYSYRRTIVKDFSDAFEEEPTVAELRAAATGYISANSLGLPSINLKVNFEHLAQYTGYENMALLETVNLGDTVSIYYEPLGVSATARIVSTTYDCLNEKYITVQVGSVKSDLSQVINQITTSTSQLKDALTKSLPSAISEAVEHVTDLITGVNGGYVILNTDANGKPYEILVMDTDDISTATNVIRMNQNGIGFGSSYNGPFNTAWTIDGNFVADYITTGTLNANVIRAGIIADTQGYNSWNLDTGAFTITNGSINIITDYNSSDVIRLKWLNSQFNTVRTSVMLPEGDDVIPYGFIGQINEPYTHGTEFEINYSLISPNLGFNRLKVVSNNGTKTLKDESRFGLADIGFWDSNRYKRISLDFTGLTFKDASNTQTATYPSTGLGVADLNDCQVETISTAGTKTYTLANGTYIVTTARLNSTAANNDGLWIVSAFSSSSYTNGHYSTVYSAGGATISVSGNTLTVTTGANNVRVTITRM